MEFTLTGVVHEGEYTSTKYYVNAVFPYQVYIPACCEGKANCGVIVDCDGLNGAEAAAVEFLQASGKAPACVSIGVTAGYLPKGNREGFDRNLRFLTYDMATGRYADFVVDELIPYLTEKYHLNLSGSPDMHLISGGSSGGICAWNMAWHRNDYFHRVYASSPSFLAMGNGEADPFLIRKYEPKPIRVFTDYSENEPDDYFGSSFVVAQNFERALWFAGYDFKCDYHHGEGHCSRRCDYEHAVFRMLYLWDRWQDTPVEVNKLSTRMEKIIPIGSKWEKAQYDFGDHKTVKTALGDYIAKDNEVVFRSGGAENVLCDSFENISAIALSCDKWRLYIADKKRRCIYAASIAADGTFDGVYLFASLHVPTECVDPGVYDMCVDTEDRIYAATEMGIQCVRSFGLVDGILLNPEKAPVEAIELLADGKLYVRSKESVFSRELQDKQPNLPDVIYEPRQIGYYD